MDVVTSTDRQTQADEPLHVAERRTGDTLRVLHVVRTLAAGGLEVGLVNVVGVLRQAGFDQAVCCLEEKGPLASQLPADVPVWSCRPQKPSRWNRHEFRAISVIRRYRPDVVHARNYGAWIDASFARAAAFNPGRLAFTIHGWDRVAPMQPRRARACRFLAKLTDGLAAVSPQTAREFADETGLSVERFEVLHSGVDTELFSPAASRAVRKSGDAFVLGCVARLDPVKGHQTLIDAVSLLRSQPGTNVELRLIGDGPVRAALEDQVRRLGLEQSVHFLGTRDDAAAQLREVDAFVLASDREGRPTSIMEAMATGLPVVATNVGSVADLVDDGETGFVIEPSDPACLANTLMSLIQHDELRKKMSEAARSKALCEFSLERMGRDYANFYQGIVGGRIGRRSFRALQPS